MNEKVWSYNERLFSLLGDKKDENLLIFAGSLTNMEDLKLIKAKKSHCGNQAKWERQRKTVLP